MVGFVVDPGRCAPHRVRKTLDACSPVSHLLPSIFAGFSPVVSLSQRGAFWVINLLNHDSGNLCSHSTFLIAYPHEETFPHIALIPKPAALTHLQYFDGIHQSMKCVGPLQLLNFRVRQSDPFCQNLLSVFANLGRPLLETEFRPGHVKGHSLEPTGP